MKEGLKITGKVKVDRYVASEDKWYYGEWNSNIVTNTGVNGLASLLNSSSAGTTWATNIGFGTSTTAVAATDTALGAELSTTGTGYTTRPSVTRSNPSANVIQYVASLTGLTSSQTIQEVGLFDAASAGNLRAHILTGAQTIGANTSDQLNVTWQITLNHA